MSAKQKRPPNWKKEDEWDSTFKIITTVLICILPFIVAGFGEVIGLISMGSVIIIISIMFHVIYRMD